MIAKELPNERRTVRLSSGGWSYTRVYHVDAEVADASERDVIEAEGLPDLWDVHPEDDTAFCQRRGPAAREPRHPTLWRVEVEWSTLSGTLRWSYKHPDPLRRPWDVEWDSEEELVTVPRDLSGAAFINSAGEPLDPPPQIKVAVPVLRITRNERSFSPALQYAYAYAVNSDGFLGASPGQVLMMPFRASVERERGLTYYVVVYEMRFRVNTDIWPRGWQPDILDAGFSELDGSGNLVVMRDQQGNPYNVPQLLDGSGHRSTSGEQVFLEYVTFKSKPFSRLFAAGAI